MMAVGLVVVAALLLIGAVVFGVLWNGKKSREITPSAASRTPSADAPRNVRTGGTE